MIPAPSKIVESYKIFNIEQKYLPATCPKGTNRHGINLLTDKLQFSRHGRRHTEAV